MPDWSIYAALGVLLLVCVWGLGYAMGWERGRRSTMSSTLYRLYRGLEDRTEDG